MSDSCKETIAKLKTEELVDFALEHLGIEHAVLRQAALQEYLSRVENDSSVVVAPTGDDKLLETKLSQIIQSA